MAELYLKQGKFLKALELYERAYKVNPERARDEYIESFRGATKSYIEDKKFQKASELYEQADKVNPEGAKDEYINFKDEYINLLMDVASSHLNRQKFEEASELYKEAYKINPETFKDEYIKLLLRYGDCVIEKLMKKGDLSNSDNNDIREAKTIFNKVLEIDSKNRRAHDKLKSLESEEDKLKGKFRLTTILSFIGIALFSLFSFFLGLKFNYDPSLQSEQELSDEEKQQRFSRGERTIFDETNEENYNDEIFSCNQKFQKKKYSEAGECFEELVDDYPNEPEPLIYKNNALTLNSKSTNYKVQIVSIAAIVSADQDEKSKEILRGVAQAQYNFNKNKFYSSNPRLLLEIEIVDDSNYPELPPKKVVNEDDRNDPEISLKVAREIVKNKSILGVIGNISKKALEVYNQENLAVISPTGISSEFNSETLLTTIDYKILSKKLAEYVLQLNVEKVVIFYNHKSPSSKSIKGYFEFYFPSNKLIREEDLKEQSFDSIVQSVIEEKFEVGILFPDSETVDSAIEMAKINYLNQEEQQLKLLGSNDLYYCDLLKKGKQAVKGLILAVPWFKGTPEAKNFSTEVKDRWGGEVSWLTAASYDGTQAFISAISSLSNSYENPTRSTVLQKVKEVNLPAKETSGENLRFSPEGEREGKAILVEVVDNSSNPDCSNLDFRPVEE